MFGNEDLPSLRDALSGRARRGIRYAFTELILVSIAAVLSGSKSLTMIIEWATDAIDRGALEGWRRAPSKATLHRIVALIDPAVLDAVVGEWVRSALAQRPTPGPLMAVAIDGKEVRGAKNAGGTRVFLLAALEHDTGVVLGQESVGGDSAARDDTYRVP